MWLMVYVVALVAVLGEGEPGRSYRARHGYSKAYSASRKTWSTSPARNGRAQAANGFRRSRQDIVNVLDSSSSKAASPARRNGGSHMTPAKSSRGSSGYSNYAQRCGSCSGSTGSPVCGSDGKTYPNQCELENVSCRKYWDITIVNQGPCQADCPGVDDFGFYTGFGLSRASNKGYCIHDFFRCCRKARKLIGNKEAQRCCQGRFDKCSAFVAAKPWRAGVKKYGR